VNDPHVLKEMCVTTRALPRAGRTAAPLGHKRKALVRNETGTSDLGLGNQILRSLAPPYSRKLFLFRSHAYDPETGDCPDGDRRPMVV
jgi:hypothetical protein